MNLEINGSRVLEIKRDSVRRGSIEVGERGMSFAGTPYLSLRRRRMTLSVTTTPMTESAALEWRNVLCGYGEDYFPTLTPGIEGWTEQGTEPTTVADTPSPTDDDGWLTLAASNPIRTMIEWPIDHIITPEDYAIYVVRGQTGQPAHGYYVTRAQGETQKYYLDGVLTAWGSVPPWLVWDSDSLTLKNDIEYAMGIGFVGIWPSHDWGSYLTHALTVGTAYTPATIYGYEIPALKPYVCLSGDVVEMFRGESTPRDPGCYYNYVVCAATIKGERLLSVMGVSYVEMDIDFEQV